MFLLRIGTASADGRSHSARQPAPSEMPRRCGEIPHGAAAACVCVLSGIAENAGRASCGAPLELRYYRLWEEAPDGTTRYGIAVEAVCNGEETRTEVPDVTSLREEIDHLLRKLARGTVTPESLREVIEDSL